MVGKRQKRERTNIYHIMEALCISSNGKEKPTGKFFLSPALQNCKGDICTSKKRNLVTLKENNYCFLGTVKKKVVMLILLAVISIQKSRQMS